MRRYVTAQQQHWLIRSESSAEMPACLVFFVCLLGLFAARAVLHATLEKRVVCTVVSLLLLHYYYCTVVCCYALLLYDAHDETPIVPNTCGSEQLQVVVYHVDPLHIQTSQHNSSSSCIRGSKYIFFVFTACLACGRSSWVVPLVPVAPGRRADAGYPPLCFSGAPDMFFVVAYTAALL